MGSVRVIVYYPERMIRNQECVPVPSYDARALITGTYAPKRLER